MRGQYWTRLASVAFAIAAVAWFGAAWPTLGVFQRGVTFALTHPAVVSRSIATPGSGIEVLDPRIVAAVQMIQDANLKTYRFSAGAAADTWFLQQTTALAWPILPSEEPSAPVLVLARSPPAGCARVQTIDEVTLARCP